jgi:AbrB family looped-hinge helix DNA binding protein
MDQVYITVSSKGQLVIPAALREELGIEPGTRVAVRREGPELILKPETLAAKLAMIKKMRGCTAGFPSGSDMLLEDRRSERERELAKDGY